MQESNLRPSACRGKPSHPSVATSNHRGTQRNSPFEAVGSRVAGCGSCVNYRHHRTFSDASNRQVLDGTSVTLTDVAEFWREWAGNDAWGRLVRWCVTSSGHQTLSLLASRKAQPSGRPDASPLRRGKGKGAPGSPRQTKASVTRGTRPEDMTIAEPPSAGRAMPCLQRRCEVPRGYSLACGRMRPPCPWT